MPTRTTRREPADGVGAVGDLATAVRRAAHRWPDRIAWTFDPGERLTFADVADRSARYAGALRELGVGRGDRVAVLLRNGPDFPLTWLALAQLGAVMVPVNVNYRTADAGYLLGDSGATALVTSREFADLVALLPAELPALRRVRYVEDLPGAAPPADEPDVWPEDPVNVQYTSGTTGRPKGCVLSHRYWMELGGGLVDGFPYLTQSDVMLTAQPFHYIDPQWNVAAALLAGAELVVLDRFHPSTFWAKVRERGVTYFYCLAAMPTLLARMPPDPADCDHRVRVVQCSAIPPALHAALEERWGAPWYETFGMTETGGDLRVTDDDHDELVGSGCLGRPTRHREVRIVDRDGRPVPRGDTGEIVLRGIGMMDGYLGAPEATAEVFRDGWFHTGDLGRMDEAGRVYYVGRTKDMIRRSGENIAAQEVEEVMAAHPRVRLVAVTAVPDELRGEEVKAYVALTPGDADVPPGELVDFCARRLAYFKVPRYWEYRDDLPRTPSERIAKHRLAADGAAVYDAVAKTWIPA